MEGPGGILRDPEAEALLRQFELFEIYTDDPLEADYTELQRELTGYNANPTYIVLDSESHLEVAREAFTNSKRKFIEFLETGLTDRPAFHSQIRLTGLSIEEAGKSVTVLRPSGSLDSSDGAEERYLGGPVRAYRGTFDGRLTFTVAEGLEPGEYVLTVQLVTGLYQDTERLATISLPRKLRFEVLPSP